MLDFVDSVVAPVTPWWVQAVIALVGVLSLAVVWLEERRVRVGLFGRYVDPSLPGGDGSADGLHTFDLEIQNFEDRPLDGPIYLHFLCHSNSRDQAHDYFRQVWVVAGPAYADLVQESKTATELVLRIESIAPLKTLGFRVETSASAISFRAAAKPEDWSSRRWRPRHVQVSRWPDELKVTTGEHSTARRVARSPSWQLFLWSAVAAAAAYIAVRLGQSDTNPWDWPVDMTLLGSIIGVAALFFWLIRRDAMPVALGYVQRQRLWADPDPPAESQGHSPKAAGPSAPQPTTAPMTARAAPSARAASGSSQERDSLVSERRTFDPRDTVHHDTNDEVT